MNRPDSAPTGVLTLVFTDIQNSATLWERLGDAFRPVLDRHNTLIRELIGRWEGYEVKCLGDSFMIAFARASNAVQCAIDIQRTLAAATWPAEVGELLIRIGMHSGEPFLGYDASGRPDYFGPMVNRAARTAAAGHGGQILASAATRDITQGALTGDVALVDLGRHRLRGLEAAEHLFEVGHAELPVRHFPPLKTLDTLRTNLPVATATFIGRERELADLRRLLNRSDTRLLTLVGFGGMGKSRTALQLAELCTEEFEEGVWWVAIEETTTGDGMLERIAHDLRVDVQPQPSVREQLFERLRDQKYLLVLDGTERVLDAPSIVNDLLHEAPRVKCLVTSRRALGLQAERVVELSPLPAGEGEALFVERARARQADLLLSRDQAAAVAELCRRLDGVPLAIELAASRITSMTPREIVERLQERFRLLQTHASDLPPRQRTLRGTIDWSHDLLSEPDRAVFARLSVCRGGFFLDAAEAVCEAVGRRGHTPKVGPAAGIDPPSGLPPAGPTSGYPRSGSLCPLPPSGTLEAVTELRERSLLHAVEAHGRMRYRMLESIREYGAERLPADGPARAAHARHYRDQTRRLAARLDTMAEAEALELFALDADNLRAAWAWSSEQSDNDLLAQLALSAGELLRRRSLWHERFTWLREGLAAAERCGTLAAEELAQLRYGLGYAHLERGEFGPAEALLDSSLAARRELGDTSGEADCLNRLGNVAQKQSRFERARACYDEALVLRQAQGDAAGEASMLNNLGVLAFQESKIAEAEARFEESLEIDRQLGNRAGEAVALNNIGYAALQRNDLQKAERFLQESRALREELGDRNGLAHTLHSLGKVAQKRRDRDAARVHYQGALRIWLELEAKHEIASQLLIPLAELLIEETKWLPAGLLLTAAATALTESGAPELQEALERLEQVRAAAGETQFAQYQRLAGRLTLLQAAERALEW